MRKVDIKPWLFPRSTCHSYGSWEDMERTKDKGEAGNAKINTKARLFYFFLSMHHKYKCQLTGVA